MDIKECQTKNETNNLHNFLKNKIIELLSNKFLCSILIINIILVLIILYIILVKNDNLIFENNDIQAIENDIVFVNTIADTKKDTLQKTAKIKVHITGEVKNSGIYELDEESRISDAIEKSGGITTDADLTKVNLAYKISDGQKIIIPSIKQEDKGNYIIEDSGENIIIDETSAKNWKININTATITELTTLPGIGESIAEKIINYREENGKFKNIEDIKNVSGIGESKYNQLKAYIIAK